MRRRRNRRAWAFCVAACAVILAPTLRLEGGLDANGFFDEYLVVGPYSNPTGGEAGEARQALDYLCDGSVNEITISPLQGLVLGAPDTGNCAAQGSGFTERETPVIRSLRTNGNVLSLNDLVGARNNVMAYAWTYVENLTPDILICTLAFSHDDGMQAQVNGAEVFNLSGTRWYGEPGFIQSRVPIALIPGPNLIAFKVFQGGGDWGVRARLEDSATGMPLLENNDLVRAGVAGTPPHGQRKAVRTITSGTGGEQSADVTLVIEESSLPYTIQEAIGFGWSVEFANGDPVISERLITWREETAATLTYRIVRNRPFTKEEAGISGFISVDGITTLVAGDNVIQGESASSIHELLLTPPFSLPGGGCEIPTSVMEGRWIGYAAAATDETIIPREGLEFRPGFNGPFSQATGLWPLEGPARNKYWTSGGPTRARYVRAASDEHGLFDFRRIYGESASDCVNVASFYVLNTTGDEPLSVILAVGSDDGTAIRVNGQVAHSLQVCRPHSLFEHQFPITLRTGKNLISVYTFNGSGEYGMSVRFEAPSGFATGFETTLDPRGYDALPFLRGDANADDAINISDAMAILGCLFLNNVCGHCLDSSDIDDNGKVEVTDAIQLLTWKFLGGPSPAPPYPECAVDPVGDSIDACETSPCS